MDTKEIIESIISDLTEDASISKIMLKAQAIASSLEIQEFSDWVRREQNGYTRGETIPDYRMCRCSAKVNLTQGMKIVSNFDVPIDAIPDKIAREMLSHIYFSDPISEIESMALAREKDALLKEVAPAYAYAKVGAIFPYANVDMLWKLVDTSAAAGIVVKVKSKMLEFFLELDKKQRLGIDFNQLDGKKEVSQVLNQTINAGIYHAGTGDIVANSSTIGNSVSVSSIDVDSLKSLIERIRDTHELDKEAEALDELSVIETEAESPCPRPKVIRKALLFLKGLSIEIGASVAAQYISNALGLL